MIAPPREASRWRAEYPFESRWFETPQGRIHYVDVGSPAAPPVLFVHGNPTWSFHWRRLIEALSSSTRCVALDHLGCGLSDKPQRTYRLAERIDHLGQLIDRLDLQDITLVAQDWGGAIGLGALLGRQQRLGRVLLFNTGAWPPESIPRRIAMCRTPLLGKLALQGGNLFSQAALRMTLARQRLSPSVAAGYLAPYDSWNNRRAVYEFVADIPSGPNHPTWSVLADIERRLPELREYPIRLVWGLEDWCFTARDCLTKFCQVWPQADVVELPGVGHWVVEDAPRGKPGGSACFSANPVSVGEARMIPDRPTSFAIRLEKNEFTFSAAHFITFAGQTCEPLHGHNYGVAVEIEGSLDENAYVVDFLAARDLLLAITGELDHRMLLPREHQQIQVSRGIGPHGGEEIIATFEERRWIFPAEECVLLPIPNTTAEKLAEWIGQRFLQSLAEKGYSSPDRLIVAVDECQGQVGLCRFGG